MEDEPIPAFQNAQEEIIYYRNLASNYKQKFKETQLELEEFQESSRELESELEAQLEQVESRNKEYRSVNNRLQMEREHLQEGFDKFKQETYNEITRLEEELSQVKNIKEELHKYVRELEQSNDDLERGKRATVSSLEDFEARLNLAIERNAFLESELDEKEALAIHVQRLKDEARDLRQELIIHQGTTKSSFFLNNPPDNDLKVIDKGNEVDSNKLSSQVQVSSPFKAPFCNTTPSNNLLTSTTPLTPSARISALNIVGDLLRKVGALESKLASCRTFPKEVPSRIGDKETGVSSPLKIKRLSKGSLSSPQDCGIPMTL